MKLSFETAGILFADVAGYSKLKPSELQTFMTTILPEVGTLIGPHRGAFQELNTWGDGLVVAARDIFELVAFALKLRDFYRNRHWPSDRLPKLQVRIGLHAGLVSFGDDPIRQRPGIVGTQVNLAARLEPVTPRNEIWVTESITKLIPKDFEANYLFDDVGEQCLAKDWGTVRAFRLRWDWEAPTAGTGGGLAETPAPVPLVAKTLPTKEQPSDAATETNVWHPAWAAKLWGKPQPCQFHIVTARYASRQRWTGLADVLVEIVNRLPDGVAGEAYLFPSAHALPSLRDADYLRSEAGKRTLDRKKALAREFANGYGNKVINGAWFVMPMKNGKTGIGVYSPDYDAYLNQRMAEAAD